MEHVKAPAYFVAQHFWLCALCLLAPHGIVCQESQTTTGDRASVQISVEASKELSEVGSGLQINGTIKNETNDPILLSEHTSVVTVPGEVDRTPEVGYYFARFPTVDELKCKDPPTNKEIDCYESLLVVPAGDTVHVFWRVNRNESSPDQLLSYTFFPPGDYKFSVQIKYWPLKPIKGGTDLAQQHLTVQDLRDSQYGNPGYRSVTATLTSHLNAPQLVILFGAAIGGFAAFLLATMRTPPRWRPLKEGFSKHLFLNIGGIGLTAVGAVVFSCVFTIMLSRLSDTRFPVKITVADFWGAVAVGFVAAYFGRSWLDKYLKS